MIKIKKSYKKPYNRLFILSALMIVIAFNACTNDILEEQNESIHIEKDSSIVYLENFKLSGHLGYIIEAEKKRLDQQPELIDTIDKDKKGSIVITKAIYSKSKKIIIIFLFNYNHDDVGIGDIWFYKDDRILEPESEMNYRLKKNEEKEFIFKLNELPDFIEVIPIDKRNLRVTISKENIIILD